MKSLCVVAIVVTTPVIVHAIAIFLPIKNFPLHAIHIGLRLRTNLSNCKLPSSIAALQR